MGNHNERRKAEADREFIHAVGECSDMTLLQKALSNFDHKLHPWKVVVLLRRMKKLGFSNTKTKP